MEVFLPGVPGAAQDDYEIETIECWDGASLFKFNSVIFVAFRLPELAKVTRMLHVQMLQY